MKKTVLAIALSISSTAVFADKVSVTLENYKWAESDLAFNNITKNVGSNAWLHFPGLTPLDQQTVVRMNRDTIYSAYIADLSKGGTITIPENDGRYISVMIVQNDHYIDQVFTKPGTYTLKTQTEFAMIAARIQINPNDPKDMENVKRLQQQVVVKNTSHNEHKMPDYNQDQLLSLRAKYVKEGDKVGGNQVFQGPRGEVDDHLHLIGTATGWGLLPPAYAQYLGYYSSGAEAESKNCSMATYKVPPIHEGGFFSLTVYNKDGWITSENSILNRYNVTFNEDGTFTAHYGNCPDNLPNRLPVEDNWDVTLRIYQPDLDKLKDYKLPKLTVMKK